MKTTSPRTILNQFVLSAIFSLVLVAGVFAAATVDASYFPVISKPVSSDTYSGQLVQADGKVVIWGTNYLGTNYVVDGQGKGMMARLNVDGTVDNSFSFCNCVPTIYGVGLQADGKFIVAGTNGNSRVVRLNADGSQDLSFGTSLGGFQGSQADFQGFAPDGKVYITHSGSLGFGYHAGYLMRLNSNGSQDTTFSVIYYDSGRNIWGNLRSIAVLPSGKLYMAVTTYSGPSGSATFRRYNADGTIDTTWEQPSMQSFGTDILTLALQADESLLIGGSFPTMNGVSRPNFIRLLPAGNVDLTFTPPAAMPVVQQIKPLASGKIIYASAGKLSRLNSDGSLDQTFVFPTTITSVHRFFALASNEQPVLFALMQSGSIQLIRLLADGEIDASFNTSVRIYGQAVGIAVQPDSKTIVAGTFTNANTLARTNLARFNSDGSADPTFDTGTGFNSAPSKIVVQPDGKILVAGPFSTFNGNPVSGLVRLNSDGTLDGSFAPVITGVVGAELEPSGKVLVFGSFSTINGSNNARLARLNADGSIDGTFNPQIASGTVYSAIQESGSKYIVGGAFTGVDGFNRGNLVRLNANGSLDQSFNSTGLGSINDVRPVAGGKYVCISGAGSPNGLLRRNSDGTADATFRTNTFLGNSDPRLYAMLIQPDGTIIIDGNFYSINGTPRGNIARFDANGNLDTLFFPIGTNSNVTSIARQANGDVIVGGQFSNFAGYSRSGIVRITPGALVRVTPFDFDGDGRADVSVFRASEGRWYILQSADLTMRQVNFAIAGDIPAPADFDGDGKTDVAIYRPSNGDWWSISSVTGQQVNGAFGLLGNIPLPQDYTGDGRADYVTYNTTSRKFARISSANGSPSDVNFGLAGDRPVIGDFNGDGLSDPAIYRPSDGNWWWKSSADGIDRATKWGLADDKCAPADYTGDGRADFGIYRPSTGVWYIYDLANNTEIIYPFGTNGDRPVSADFDGDGRADTSVFRPSDGIWYLLRSTAGYTGYQWGIATDAAVPNVYVPQ